MPAPAPCSHLLLFSANRATRSPPRTPTECSPAANCRTRDATYWGVQARQRQRQGVGALELSKTAFTDSSIPQGWPPPPGMPCQAEGLEMPKRLQKGEGPRGTTSSADLAVGQLDRRALVGVHNGQPIPMVLLQPGPDLKGRQGGRGATAAGACQSRAACPQHPDPFVPIAADSNTPSSCSALLAWLGLGIRPQGTQEPKGYANAIMGHLGDGRHLAQRLKAGASHGHQACSGVAVDISVLGLPIGELGRSDVGKYSRRPPGAQLRRSLATCAALSRPPLPAGNRRAADAGRQRLLGPEMRGKQHGRLPESETQ